MNNGSQPNGIWPHYVVMAAKSFSQSDPLRDFLDDGRASEGATARSALFWRGHIEAESSTLVGLLVFCVETGEKVRVTLRNGTVRHGQVLSVGLDVLRLATDNGCGNLVAVDHVESLRGRSKRLTASDRTAEPTTMREQLGKIAEQRASVRVVMRSGAEEHGVLVGCGSDMCILQNEQREHIYVSIPSIGEVAVLP